MNETNILMKMAKRKSLTNDEKDFLVKNGFAYFDIDFSGRTMILTEKGRIIFKECDKKLYNQSK